MRSALGASGVFGTDFHARLGAAAAERASYPTMTSTVTITHHQKKPEYQWEVVIPEEATLMLQQDHFSAALDALGLPAGADARRQIEELSNGSSQSINAEVNGPELDKLKSLSVKTR